MANESRLSITIDSRSAEQQAKDLEVALNALDQAGIRVVNTAHRTSKTTTATGRTFSAAGREAKQGAGGVDDLNRSLAKTDDQAARTAATLRRVLLAATAGFSAMSIIDTGDEWGQYASRIRMATDSAEEYDHVQKRMVQSANETYRSIQETRESFIQMAPVIREMGYSLDQSIDAVDAFSGLLVVNAANSHRGAAAMSALSRAMQKGKIDADAWMTIYSTVDSVVDVIAKSSGMAAAEIRKLGAEGKLSVDVLTKALVDGNGDIMESVRQMPTTVRDAMQNIGNAFSEYIGWNNEAAGVTAGMASGLGVLGDNFEVVANTIGIVAAGALTIYTSRMVGATAATVTSMVAARALAAETLREAQAQAAQTAITLAQTRAMQGLTATHAQVTAATVAHEGAVKRLTVAQAGYTRIGAALLGVMGGPVGLVATAGLAAASFLMFRGESDQTSASVAGLTQKIDALNTSTQELTQNQAKQAMLELQPVMDEARAKVALLEDNVAGLSHEMKRIPPGSPLFSEFEDALTRARGDLDTATGAVDRLTARLGDLQGVAAGAGQAVAGAAAAFSEEYLKLEATLSKQIALLGKTGQAAQHRYDLEHGELSMLSDAEKNGLKVKIDTLEAGEKALEASRKGAKATKTEAKEIEGLLKSLRDQASVLGMTEQQAARYRIETAKGTEAQRQEALALLDTVQAHKAAEQATKLHIDAMREQRNLASEIAVFRDQQELSITGLGLGERVRQELQSEYAIREEFARRQRELDEAQLVEATRMSEDAYRQQVAYLREAEEEKIGILRESAARRLVAEQGWITGAQEGLKNYANEAANVYSSVQSAVSNSFKGMEEALVNFVRTGKLDFKSLADSIISDMARIAIQQSVTGPLAGAIGSAIGGMFGPSAAPAGATPGVDWTFGGGRATGGPVSAGKMYEVNERGTPELLNIGKRQFLMMGQEGGHVTPAGAGSSSGGGSASQAQAVPNVSVNITNTSGQQVGASQPKVSMDALGNLFIELMLNDNRKNGPMTRSIRGAM